MRTTVIAASAHCLRIRVRKRVLALIVLLFLFLTACDHTKLQGEIRLLDTPSVGKSIGVLLEVPKKFEGINRVMWDIEPSEVGEIRYGDELKEEYEEGELEEILQMEYHKINFDRVAIFTLHEEEAWTIHASGFYKQTNPQPIAEISDRP